MTNFLQTLKDSVYNPAFYKEAREHSFSKALVYFLKYTLLLSVVASVITLFSLWGFFYGGGLKHVLYEVMSVFPQELVVSVDRGVISTNQEEPYGILMPGKVSGEDGFQYLVMFDTAHPVTMEAAQAYDTAVLVGAESIGTFSDSGQFRIVPIGTETSFTLDRSVIENFFGKIESFAIKFGFLILAFLIPSFLFLGLFLGVMVYMLFGALVIWLIATLKGIKMRYGQAYILGLYMITLPQAVSTVFGFAVFFIPFFRTIVLAVIAGVNLKQDDPQLATHDLQQTTDDVEPKQEANIPEIGSKEE